MWSLMDFGYALLDTAELLAAFFITPLAELPGFDIWGHLLPFWLPASWHVGTLLVGTGLVLLLQLKVIKFVLDVISAIWNPFGLLS